MEDVLARLRFLAATEAALDADVERIIEAIKSSLKSHMIGEGKIFVTTVEDAIRTRTGERGEDAIR